MIKRAIIKILDTLLIGLGVLILVYAFGYKAFEDPELTNTQLFLNEWKIILLGSSSLIVGLFIETK